MGVIGMTKEHLGLALALNVPVFVVITKIDMCPPNVFQETVKILQKILKLPMQSLLKFQTVMWIHQMVKCIL